MKLAFPVATPEVSGRVLAWQGDLADIAPRLAALGYSGVELFVRDPVEIAVEPLAATLAQAGLEVAAIGTGPIAVEDRLTFSDPRSEVRAAALARACAVVDLAARLHSQVNVGKLRGTINHAPPAASWRDAAFRALEEHARGRGVILTLEPQHSGIIDNLNSTDSGLAWIRSQDLPNLQLMLDSYHMDLEDASLPAALRMAQPHLRHAHVSDSGRRVPGQGRINFVEFVRTLREIGYDRFLTVEVDQVPDSPGVAAAAAAYLRPLLASLTS
jgi:5-keto-L-gluconate epimerase